MTTVDRLAACKSVVSCQQFLVQSGDETGYPGTWFITHYSGIQTPLKILAPLSLGLWGAGVVVCLEQGADLHMAQLMPLPLTVSCFSKIQIGFTFLVPAHLGSPGKGAVKRECACVCKFGLVTGLIFCTDDCMAAAMSNRKVRKCTKRLLIKCSTVYRHSQKHILEDKI